MRSLMAISPACGAVGIVSLFAVGAVHADSGNCSKSEILDLAKSGWNRADITRLCAEVTSLPNCCCAQTFDAGDRPITRGRLDYQLKNGGRIYFRWEDADTCGIRHTSLCVEKSYCGRD